MCSHPVKNYLKDLKILFLYHKKFANIINLYNIIGLSQKLIILVQKSRFYEITSKTTLFRKRLIIRSTNRHPGYTVNF